MRHNSTCLLLAPLHVRDAAAVAGTSDCTVTSVNFLLDHRLLALAATSQTLLRHAQDKHTSAEVFQLATSPGGADMGNETSPRESPNHPAASAFGGFQDDDREPAASLSELLSDEHRDTVRDLAEQMRESGVLRIKLHREMHNGRLGAADNSFKGECAPAAPCAFRLFVP